MSLRISTEKAFTVLKELRYVDQSLDPTKARAGDGNYMKVAVMDPMMITFKKGLHEYTDKDLVNNPDNEPIESILEWPTIRAFIKKGVIIVATGVVGADEEPAPKASKTKKPLSFE